MASNDKKYDEFETGLLEIYEHIRSKAPSEGNPVRICLLPFFFFFFFFASTLMDNTVGLLGSRPLQSQRPPRIRNQRTPRHSHISPYRDTTNAKYPGQSAWRMRSHHHR